uniref:Uncharacterized protein n=1 Tax=Candidatus Kentrum sp. LFY TaxID=2126342 RepID=A0A450UKU8_9GAMM|nr:MAG: hypothetical protein BECKLFY1418B_GA0070995_104218 [Candidatus Kentron sp. LFY]
MKNHLELYEYSKSVFDEEISRFHRIQNKAGVFITIIASFIGIFSAMIVSSHLTAFVQNKFSEELILVIIVGFLLSFIFAFLSFRIEGIKMPPLNQDMISVFKDHQIDDIYYGFSEAYISYLEENRRICDQKIDKLKYSYWLFFITVVLSMMAIVWIVLSKPS